MREYHCLSCIVLSRFVLSSLVVSYYGVLSSHRIYLLINLFFYLFISVFLYFCIFLFIYLFIYLFFYLFMY